MASEINTEINDWVSVNTLTGIVVGTRIKMQNKGSKHLLSMNSAIKPDINSFEGELITPIQGEEPSKIVTENSTEVWVRRKESGSGQLKMYVQEWAV